MKKCVVCGKKYNALDPASRPPACSKDCRSFWISDFIDHKGEPCWIPGCLEVFCGTRTPGHCLKCEVFKIEEKINKRGLNKEFLIWGA